MVTQPILNVDEYPDAPRNGHMILETMRNAIAHRPPLIVEDEGETDPDNLLPAPVAGKAYLISTGTPVGAWAGQAGKVAMYYGSTWKFRTLQDGEMFTVLNEGNGVPARGKLYYNAAGTYIAIFITP